MAFSSSAFECLEAALSPPSSSQTDAKIQSYRRASGQIRIPGESLQMSCPLSKTNPGAGGVNQLVECLAGVHKALGLRPSTE